LLLHFVTTTPYIESNGMGGKDELTKSQQMLGGYGGYHDKARNLLFLRQSMLAHG
jgi:hypothetical protein